MKWKVKDYPEIQPLDIPDLPKNIIGRLRKDGKPDERYTKGMYMLEEYLKNASGSSDEVRS